MNSNVACCFIWVNDAREAAIVVCVRRYKKQCRKCLVLILGSTNLMKTDQSFGNIVLAFVHIDEYVSSETGCFFEFCAI